MNIVSIRIKKVFGIAIIIKNINNINKTNINGNNHNNNRVRKLM